MSSQFPSAPIVCAHAHFLRSWMALQKILTFLSMGLYLGSVDWNDVQWDIEFQLSGV